MPKKVDEQQKKKLLKAFEELWSKAEACKEVGISERTWYNIEKRDPKFKEEALRIASKMVRKARRNLGELIDAKNLSAIIFFLKHYDKELAQILKDRYQKKGEGPPLIPLGEVSKEEVKAYAKVRQKQREAKIK